MYASPLVSAEYFIHEKVQEEKETLNKNLNERHYFTYESSFWFLQTFCCLGNVCNFAMFFMYVNICFYDVYLFLVIYMQSIKMFLKYVMHLTIKKNTKRVYKTLAPYFALLKKKINVILIEFLSKNNALWNLTFLYKCHLTKKKRI